MDGFEFDEPKAKLAVKTLPKANDFDGLDDFGDDLDKPA